MKRFPIACMIAAMVAISCEQKEKQATPSPVDSMRTVVMDLHNLEMEKMGEMKMLERELKSAMAELDSVAEGEKYQLLDAALIQLDSGEFAMKSWMRNWKEPDTLASEALQMEGLAQQHESMKRTRDLMHKGIKAAKSVLGHEE